MSTGKPHARYNYQLTRWPAVGDRILDDAAGTGWGVGVIYP